MDSSDIMSLHDIGSEIGMEGIKFPSNVLEKFELTEDETKSIEQISSDIEGKSETEDETNENKKAYTPSFGGSCSAGCAGSCEGSCYSICADTCYNRCLGSYTS